MQNTPFPPLYSAALQGSSLGGPWGLAGRPRLVLRHVAGVLHVAVHGVPQDEAAGHAGVGGDVHVDLGRPVGEAAGSAELAALPRVHVDDLHGGPARGRRAPLPPLALCRGPRKGAGDSEGGAHGGRGPLSLLPRTQDSGRGLVSRGAAAPGATGRAASAVAWQRRGGRSRDFTAMLGRAGRRCHVTAAPPAAMLGGQNLAKEGEVCN